MTNFFYLKLGPGNCLAKYWLNLEEKCLFSINIESEKDLKEGIIPEGLKNKLKASGFSPSKNVKRDEEDDWVMADKDNKKVKLIIRKDDKKLKIYERIPNIDNKPAAAIYFGMITTEEIEELSKKEKEKVTEKFKKFVSGKRPDLGAAKDFVEAGKKLGENTFITIAHDKVYIFEPSGEVKDMPEDKWREYDKVLDDLSQAKTAAGTKKNIKAGTKTKKDIFEEMKIKIESFIIDSELEADLNNNNGILKKLKEEFKTNGIPLSKSATIEKWDKDNEWVITDDPDGKGKIYIARKKDEKLKIYRHIPKIMPVKNIKKYEIANVPHVLATLSTSMRHAQGTCRKITDNDKNWGAIQAISYVLSDQKIEVKEDYELIKLLSPYELETLVFLILKNAGLFVPAWRGGTQKGIDIIGRNKTESQIKLPPVTFEPGKGKTFQIKKYIDKSEEILGNADFIVTVDPDINGKADTDKILDAKWLLKQIKSEKQQDKTKEWLKTSLDWVENIEFLF